MQGCMATFDGDEQHGLWWMRAWLGGSGCGAFSSPGKVQRHWVDARIPISD